MSTEQKEVNSSAKSRTNQIKADSQSSRKQITKLKPEPDFHRLSHPYGFTTAAFARLFRSHDKPTLERSARPAEPSSVGMFSVHMVHIS